MKAIDYAARVPMKPGGIYTREEYAKALQAALRRDGIKTRRATYDRAGNCKTCREAGSCPGVHTLEEIAASLGIRHGGRKSGAASLPGCACHQGGHHTQDLD